MIFINHIEFLVKEESYPDNGHILKERTWSHKDISLSEANAFDYYKSELGNDASSVTEIMIYMKLSTNYGTIELELDDHFSFETNSVLAKIFKDLYANTINKAKAA